MNQRLGLDGRPAKVASELPLSLIAFLLESAEKTLKGVDRSCNLLLALNVAIANLIPALYRSAGVVKDRSTGSSASSGSVKVGPSTTGMFRDLIIGNSL